MKKSNEQLVSEYRNGDSSALTALCEQNRGLVANIARGFTGNREDLFQSGMIGIIEAANKFDAENGAKFTTYASYWIFSYCVTCAREMNGTVTVTGRDGRRVLTLISRAKAALVQELGREPTIEEISRSMGISEDVVSAVAGVSSESLNASRQNDDSGQSTLSEIIPDTAPTPAGIAEQSSLQAAVHKFEEELKSDVEKFIFKNVIAGDMTFQEAGDIFGITRQRTHQIASRIRPKFKEYAISMRLDRA